MDLMVLERLYAEGLISARSYERIKWKQAKGLLSVHWEIKTLLYLGVLLLSGGLGILIYKNIDTIGHQVILLFIALVCAGCFYYCFKKKLPFSPGKVTAPNTFFDYVLLLGCSTFIIFIAYVQYQYNLFGNRFGLACFFPMILLFFSAYYFDHLGVLSMAIVNLAAWMGLTVTPLEILTSNDFKSDTVIFTGLALGTLLTVMAWLTRHRNFKRHYEFTYANFGIHILFISTLAAMFHFTLIYLAWFLLLAVLAYLFYRKAIQEKSFYFILIITLYAFVGTSYVVLNILNQFGEGMAAVYLGFLYFIVSAIGLVLFLIRTNKKMKAI
ncbi:MAG: DUF2157 domain-containing protein [Ferruginibacter sp.]